MEDNHEMENRESGNNPKEKYIHVTDIPTEKLDEDQDYKNSEDVKNSEKETDTDSDLEEKTKEDQSQGDETIGIP